MATLEDAISLAVSAHKGQRDKVGQPYILHPLRVMFRLESDEARIVAILHDVLEDTPITKERLRELGYAEHLITALDHLTHREGESYQDFITRAAQDPIAKQVKLADLEDNMDVRRLTAVSAKDAARLAKYCESWHRLKKM
jgi:(p)ppGpp synthase/HD superfamily hydrolase